MWNINRRVVFKLQHFVHKLNYALPLPHGRWLLSRLALREKYLADDLHNVKIDHGLMMDLRPSDNWTDMRVYFNLMEPEIKEAMSRTVRVGDTVIDVGSHMGYFSLLLAYWVGPEGRVFSFEPNPEVYGRFGENVRLNSFGDRIHGECVAISNEVGDQTFYVNAGRSDLGSLKSYSGQQSMQIVSVTTLDQVDRDYQISGLSLVKVDVEGAELFVLEGGKELIGREQPVIICEVSKHQQELFGYTLKDLQHWANQNDYRLVWAHNGKPATRSKSEGRDQPHGNVLMFPKGRIG